MKSLNLVIKREKDDNVFIPWSRARNKYIKTVGVAIDWFAKDAMFTLSPINSRGTRSRCFDLALPFDSQILGDLEKAFGLLREFRDRYEKVRLNETAVEELYEEFRDKWYKSIQ